MTPPLTRGSHALRRRIGKDESGTSAADAAAGNVKAAAGGDDSTVDSVDRDEVSANTATEADTVAAKVDAAADRQDPEADKQDAEADTDQTVAEEDQSETDADQSETDADQTEVEDDGAAQQTNAGRRGTWARVIVYGAVPAIAFLLAVAAGYLKWQDTSARNDATARIESAQAAKDATVAILSYQPNTVEQQLGAARDLITGEFRDSYTQLIRDVVIPGAKQKRISSIATVPAVSSVSAHEKHAVALVYVNQTTIIGNDPPSDSTSAVRVTMDKLNGRWLVSRFDPV